MTLHPLSLGALSLFFPGLGQLASGHVGKAMYFGVLALFMWVLSLGLFGWVIHICAAFDAWHYGKPALMETRTVHVPNPEIYIHREDPEKDIVWH